MGSLVVTRVLEFLLDSLSSVSELVSDVQPVVSFDLPDEYDQIYFCLLLTSSPLGQSDHRCLYLRLGDKLCYFSVVYDEMRN